MTTETKQQVVNRMVQTGDYKTHVMEGGDTSTETIIFLHGSGPGAGAQSNWQYVLPEFADKFHVLAPDFYGFGRTEHPENPPENGVKWLRARINQIIDLMDELKIEKAHLVGNSLGGVISLHLLMEAPERFDKVILMGAGGGKFEPSAELMKLQNFHKDPTRQALKNLFRWFVYDEAVITEEQIGQIADERFDLFLQPEVRKSYEATFTNATLADLAVPTSAMRRMENEMLLIHGHQDKIVPLESSLFMMEHLPNAQLHVFKRCGHWAQIEQKDRFVKLTKDFFSNEL